MPRTFHVHDWVGHEILGFCFNLFCLFPVMPKVRRNIRPEGVIGGKYVGRGFPRAGRCWEAWALQGYRGVQGELAEKYEGPAADVAKTRG